MPALLALLLACGTGTIESTVDEDDGSGRLDTGAVDAALCINELMPDNQGALVEDDATPDWVELYNAEFETVSLVGWTLQLDGLEPVPLDALGALEATEPLLLFAAGIDDVREGQLPFTLDATGGALTLTGPNGTGQRIVYGVVQTNHAVARETDCCEGPECLVFTRTGTPGEENGG
ncbi:MAG: lamin tail domain-containing protein [Myxococcota bacterium]|nr:lamin tail domain-containing protein [Myxococcota bacterium]